MEKLTLLEENQIFGDSAIEIIRKRGTKTAITDYAMLLGGYVSDNYSVDDSNSLDKRTGWYWTKTKDNDNDEYINNACMVNVAGYKEYHDVAVDFGGIRPCMTFSSIDDLTKNRKCRRAKDGILEIEYGHYPRKAVTSDLYFELENCHRYNQLTKTGNKYRTDYLQYFSESVQDIIDNYDPYEYEYKGKKYVRVNPTPHDHNLLLSNGEKHNPDNIIWVEVEPVKWLVDEKTNIMITEEIIASGVDFGHSLYTGNFENTEIKKYIDKYLSTELFQNIVKKDTNIISQSEELIKELHSKGFTPQQIKLITQNALDQISQDKTITESKTK